LYGKVLYHEDDIKKIEKMLAWMRTFYWPWIW